MSSFSSGLAFHQFEYASHGNLNRLVNGDAAVRIKSCQNIAGAIKFFSRFSDPDLDPPDGVGLKRLQNRGDAKVPTGTTL